MPASNPRLSIVVTPKVAATLKRVAALQNRSQSAVAADFLAEVEPVLARVANMLELAAQAKTQWPKEFVGKLEKAQDETEQHALRAMSQLDMIADGIATAVKQPAVPGRTRMRAPNRGRRARRKRS